MVDTCLMVKSQFFDDVLIQNHWDDISTMFTNRLFFDAVSSNVLIDNQQALPLAVGWGRRIFFYLGSTPVLLV